MSKKVFLDSEFVAKNNTDITFLSKTKVNNVNETLDSSRNMIKKLFITKIREKNFRNFLLEFAKVKFEEEALKGKLYISKEEIIKSLTESNSDRNFIFIMPVSRI